MAVTSTGMDEASAYIERVLSLPEDGESLFIGVHNTFEPKDFTGKKLPFGSGAIGNSVGALTKIIFGMLRSRTNRDIYVCMGTQMRYMEGVNKRTGEIYFRPDKHRSNIARLRSLFIDTDFKGGKSGHASQADAETALAKFLSDTSLPPPNVVVHSGGGFHLYWVLSHPLSVEDWQPLADALNEATRQHGFKCDTNVTGDASRILRVPGTLNYKSDPPKTVKLHAWLEGNYDVEQIRTALTPYMSIVTPKVSVNQNYFEDAALFQGAKPFQGFQSKEEITELGDGIVQGGPPIPLKKVIPECGFIKEALQTGGAAYDNTLWNLTTLLATFTQEGERAAHMMARKHPDYDPDNTSKLYERKLAERDRGVGWPKCATLKNSGSKPCATCKHFVAGQYPFSVLAGDVTPEVKIATPVDSTITLDDSLPEGYLRNKAGLIYFLSEADKHGDSEEIYPTLSHLSDAYVTTHGEAMLHMTANISPVAPSKKVMVPFKSLHGMGTAMTDTLASAGISINNKFELSRFLVSWTEKLKQSKNTHSAHPPYGWAVNEASGQIEGFSFGQRLYTPNGEYITNGGDMELAKQYTARGELAQWVEASKQCSSSERAGIDVILAASFAGPLVYFTGEAGMFLNIWSQISGVGKTTTMRTAQAVWGSPEMAMQGLSDTAKSVLEKMSALKHLSLFWDEIKSPDAFKKIILILFELTGGKGPARLRSDIQQRAVGNWKTMLLSACNSSLLDAVEEMSEGNEAGFYRLFEIEVDRAIKGMLSPGAAAQINTAVSHNYGVAGAVYAQWLGNNFHRIQGQVSYLQDKLAEQLGYAQAERFWLNIAVTVLLGAKYANELGLTFINLSRLKGCLFEAIEQQRKTLVEQPIAVNHPDVAIALLVSYLQEKSARHCLKTNLIWRQQGKPTGITPVFSAAGINANDLHIQIGVQDGFLRIEADHMDRWLKQRGQTKSPLIKALKQHAGLASVKASLFGGIPHIGSGQTKIYEIEYTKIPELAGLMAEVQTVGSPMSNVVPLVKP